jgi:2-amino-4-hydroxy-6-hydroxymethyldihydropteridine diphosphokinase
MKPAARVFVALGSNLGDRRASLESALVGLAGTPGVRVRRVSSWRETAPVGGPAGQGPFLNGVVELETTLEPRQLLEALFAIERDQGRRREVEVRHGPRTLDLDLLLFGERILDEPGLCLPHPRLKERLFVLEPLAELAGELVLPGSRSTVRELAARLAPPAVSPAQADPKSGC